MNIRIKKYAAPSRTNSLIVADVVHQSIDSDSHTNKNILTNSQFFVFVVLDSFCLINIIM